MATKERQKKHGNVWLTDYHNCLICIYIIREREPDDKCLYKKLFLDYRVGLNKIYTEKEIEKARASPSFYREYDLKYLGKIGNVFNPSVIEKGIEKGRTYDPSKPNQFAPMSLGIDPAFGSSKFALVLTQLVNAKIEVLYAEEFERPDFNEMISKCVHIIKNYSMHWVNKVYVDAANPAIITALKAALAERIDYEQMISELKFGHNDGYIDLWMRVVPVPFSTEGKQMLGNAKLLMEMGKIAIHPKFTKLITALRTATATENMLDKNFPYNDLFDALRLSVKYYKIPNQSILAL
jgi:hypothetical protein